MTRAAAPRLHGTVGTGRPQWARAAATHLQVYLYLWMVGWAVVVVAVTVAIAVIAMVNGSVPLSIAQFVRNGPLVWFLFAIAIMVTTMYLAPHVANGMTRRSFIRGSLVAATGNGLLHGVTAAVVVLVEGAVFDRLGWAHAAPEGQPGLWERGAGILLLDHTLTALAGTVTGLLVGIAYYRLGGWWATLALPLTLSPILVLMLTTSWRDAPFAPWGLPPATAYAVTAVLTLAAALAFALLTRRVPIARTES